MEKRKPHSRYRCECGYTTDDYSDFKDHDCPALEEIDKI